MFTTIILCIPLLISIIFWLFAFFYKKNDTTKGLVLSGMLFFGMFLGM